jgi:hypothetical protein
MTGVEGYVERGILGVWSSACRTDMRDLFEERPRTGWTAGAACCADASHDPR